MILCPIHHTFAPLADAAFCRQALGLLLRPWTWKKGRAVDDLRSSLRESLNAEPFLFSSGREGLFALLSSLGIKTGDEVIVQAYTCVVVPNAIAATGATPVFVDVAKDTLSLDPGELRKAITPKTKAIICQHTFGIPAPLEDLRAICDEHQIPLIEDCAHIIPDADGPDGLARTGDFVLLSFGRDKAISGVTGGAILSRKTDMNEQLRRQQESARDLPLLSIKRLLLYPLIYGMARPVYGLGLGFGLGLGLGKILLKICSVLGLLPTIVTVEEKTGHQSRAFHKIPNACAALALSQLRKLKEINDHRRTLTRFYLEQCATYGWPVLHGIGSDLPLQKFPMFVSNAEKIRRELKKKNIYLNDGWTGCVICPESVDPSVCGYRHGNDPKAEEISQQILSLPTHPLMTLKDVERLTYELRAHQRQALIR